MIAVLRNLVGRLLLACNLLPVSAAGIAEAACDSATAGQRQFAKCAACHSLEPGVHMMGPSLAGLKGRQAGSVTGFVFSPAMAQADRAWNRDTLSDFLTNPADSLPGNAMPFGGLRDEAQREALVEFLLESPVDSTDCP